MGGPIDACLSSQEVGFRQATKAPNGCSLVELEKSQMGHQRLETLEHGALVVEVVVAIMERIIKVGIDAWDACLCPVSC